MIVYLVRDIPAFVMYCVNGESGSSLLIESTNSMIIVSMVLDMSDDVCYLVVRVLICIYHSFLT